MPMDLLRLEHLLRRLGLTGVQRVLHSCQQGPRGGEDLSGVPEVPAQIEAAAAVHGDPVALPPGPALVDALRRVVGDQ